MAVHTSLSGQFLSMTKSNTERTVFDEGATVADFEYRTCPVVHEPGERIGIFVREQLAFKRLLRCRGWSPERDRHTQQVSR